jgi:NADPH:quinone reductase
VGAEVREVRVGQRVAWCDVPGSYATHVCAPEERLVPVPEGVSSELAAASMLQGMTAHYLSHDTYHLTPGDACLVHAAAGGVGLLLCQMAKRRGARVVGTVSSDEKAQLALEAGADHVIRYDLGDWAQQVAEATSGRGAQVVYDSVGQRTWEQSLACLAPRGMLVLFGQSSGPVPPIDPQRLARGGSLFLTRASLFHYVSTRAELLSRAQAIFGMLTRGEVRVRIDRTLPLERAAEAQRLLASRTTAGKLLLSV